MSKNIEDREDNAWAIQIGFYPGIVLGFRTYENPENRIHVLYLPVLDFALIIPN